MGRVPSTNPRRSTPLGTRNPPRIAGASAPTVCTIFAPCNRSHRAPSWSTSRVESPGRAKSWPTLRYSSGPCPSWPRTDAAPRVKSARKSFRSPASLTRTRPSANSRTATIRVNSSSSFAFGAGRTATAGPPCNTTASIAEGANPRSNGTDIREARARGCDWSLTFTIRRVSSGLQRYPDQRAGRLGRGRTRGPLVHFDGADVVRSDFGDLASSREAGDLRAVAAQNDSGWIRWKLHHLVSAPYHRGPLLNRHFAHAFAAAGGIPCGDSGEREPERLLNQLLHLLPTNLRSGKAHLRERLANGRRKELMSRANDLERRRVCGATFIDHERDQNFTLDTGLPQDFRITGRGKSRSRRDRFLDLMLKQHVAC